MGRGVRGVGWVGCVSTHHIDILMYCQLMYYYYVLPMYYMAKDVLGRLTNPTWTPFPPWAQILWGGEMKSTEGKIDLGHVLSASTNHIPLHSQPLPYSVCGCTKCVMCQNMLVS